MPAGKSLPIKLRQQRVCFEELEPRLLFSADLGGYVLDTTAVGLPLNDPTQNQLEIVVSATDETLSTPATNSRHELVFVDSNVPGLQQLLDDLLAERDDDRQIEVLILNSEQDGIEQISQTLVNYRDLSAIHFVSHGSDGQVQLANSLLSINELDTYSSAIKDWGNALGEEADLLFYGCNLASTQDGLSLIDAISTLTGADVAASSDTTGHTLFGGDWELEYHDGEIEHNIVFSSTFQQNWQGLLATPELWFSTNNDVTASGIPELNAWTDGEGLVIGDPNLSLEPGTTTGTFSSAFNLDNFAGDGNANIDAMHYVTTNITVGSTNSVDLQIGDILLSTRISETFTSTNSLSVNDEDVFVFRPDAVGDYSSGTFTFLLDGSQIHGDDTKGLTLVEQQTTVGDATLNAGTFLISTNGINERIIYHFSAADVGLNTTTGAYNNLIHGPDINISNGIRGIELIESDMTIGGVNLTSGQVLVTLNDDDGSVGDNAIAANTQDIFYLDVTTTGQSTTQATATLLLDGSDVNLNSTAEAIHSVALVNDPAANSAPTAANNTVNTNEDVAYTFIESDFNFSDIDGDSLTQIQITSLETVGSLELSGVAVTLNQVIAVADITAGNLTFVPVTNANGAGYDSFGFKVYDGIEYSALAYTMTVDVTAQNDPPTASNNTVATNEDTTYTLNLSDFNFSDVDGDSLTQIQITSLETVGSLELSGVAVTLNQVVAVADITAGNLTFVPSSNANGASYDSFDFRVHDGTEYSTLAYTMTIDVTAIQDAPTAANNTVVTNEDSAYTFSLTDFNFNDVDGDSISQVQITSLESNGSLELSGVAVTLNQVISAANITAGNLTFVPAANINGANYDSFAFKVHDGTEYSVAASTMTVDVTSQNDAPTGSNNTVITDQNITYTFRLIDFNFSDIEGDSISQIQITSLESNGSLTLSGVAVTLNQVIGTANIMAGQLKFTPAVNASGTSYDSFSFRVHDGSAYSANVYTMMINVVATNIEPTIDPDNLNEDASQTDEQTKLEETTDTAADIDLSANQALQHSMTGDMADLIGIAKPTSVQIPNFELADHQNTTEDNEENTPQSDKDSLLKLQMFKGANINYFINTELNLFNDQLPESYEWDGNGNLITSSAQISGISLAVGVSAWALRGGSVMASLLSTMPAWRGFDPLPVLSAASHYSAERRSDNIDRLFEKSEDGEEDKNYGKNNKPQKKQ